MTWAHGKVFRSVACQTSAVRSSTRPRRLLSWPKMRGAAGGLQYLRRSMISAPAQKLGVSPERLLAAVKAAAPPPLALEVPPSPDELVNRFAQNLGMSPEKVRAAIRQVEEPNRFYFVLPLRGSGQSS